MKQCVIAAVLVGAGVTALTFLMPLAVTDASAQANASPLEHWVATWTATLEGGPPQTNSSSPLATVKNQTVRIPLKISVGGPRLRLRLSNQYGAKPLVIGAASVASANEDWTVRPFTSVPDGIAISKANSDWTVKAGTFAQVRFGGAPQVTIAPGGYIVSDPVEMKTTALQQLAISLYLPEDAVLFTYHNEQAGGSSARPVIASGAVISTEGDFTSVATIPLSAPSAGGHVYPAFLAAIDTVVPASTPVVVIFGDTWSEGPGFWSTFLRDRLAPRGIAVVNQSQVAGRLMPMGLSRFDRDVLGTSGATHVFLFMGANDVIGSRPENPTPGATIGWAMKQVVDRAHAGGLRVIAATVLPLEGVSEKVRPGLASPEHVRLQGEVNAWMRANRGLFDGLVEFDALLRDPQQPTRLLPAYDVGNHFTPSEAGSRKLADAIDEKLFRK